MSAINGFIEPVPTAFAYRCRVLANRSIVTAIGAHDRLAIFIPFGFGQRCQIVDDPERRIGIRLPNQRLNLEQRFFVVDLDRPIRCGQPDVDEQRAEPAIGLNDAFVAFEALASGQINRWANEEAPTWRGFHEQT